MAALDRQGVCGIRLNLVGLPMPDFARAEWQRFFGRVRALDWHVELHRESRDLPLAGSRSSMPAASWWWTTSAGPARRPATTRLRMAAGAGGAAGACGSSSRRPTAAGPTRAGSAARDAATALLQALGPTPAVGQRLAAHAAPRPGRLRLRPGGAGRLGARRRGAPAHPGRHARGAVPFRLSKRQKKGRRRRRPKETSMFPSLALLRTSLRRDACCSLPSARRRRPGRPSR